MKAWGGAAAIVAIGAVCTHARAADVPARRKAPPSNEEMRDPPPDRGSAFFAIRAAIEAGARDFTYVDRITPTLRPYRLPITPLAAVDAELYPLSHTHTPVLDDFGLTFAYATAFAVASADAAGTKVGTSWTVLDAGARERIHLGRAVLAGLHGGFGQIEYAFDDALPRAQLPSVRYQFVRAGADLRIALGRWALSFAGSYLGVLSTGLLGTYFPRATEAGIEGRAGVSVALARGLEASFDAIYTRFYFAMHPAPGDAYVAGGALDQMGRVSLGLAYFF